MSLKTSKKITLTQVTTEGGRNNERGEGGEDTTKERSRRAAEKQPFMGD